MALTATIYTFDIDLADTDRGRDESLALRVAMDMTLSVADRHMLVALGGAVVEGSITRHRLGPVN